MEDRQTNHSTNEFEVVEMFRIDTGVRVDLKGIVVMSGVFEQAVERVKHFVRKQEKELSRETTIIKTIFTIKLDHQSLLQIRGRLAHDLSIRIFEDVRSANLDMALSGKDA